MITGDMTIKEIIRKYPATKRILKYYDMLSSGCG
jgi:hypothetical protein